METLASMYFLNYFLAEEILYYTVSWRSPVKGVRPTPMLLVFLSPRQALSSHPHHSLLCCCAPLKVFLSCKLWSEMNQTTLGVGHFKTLSGHFFANYINSFHKIATGNRTHDKAHYSTLNRRRSSQLRHKGGACKAFYSLHLAFYHKWRTWQLHT